MLYSSLCRQSFREAGVRTLSDTQHVALGAGETKHKKKKPGGGVALALGKVVVSLGTQ